MRRSRSTASELQDRRGATLVLVAMLLVVLIGFTGVGVDFARMYAFKTQLKTVTDASAMAGVIEMTRQRRANMEPEILALAQRPLNKVEGAGTAEVLGTDVDAVQWDFDSRAVVASFGDNYAAPDVNAIRVIGRYQANFTFGRIFGINTTILVDTTVAALGGVGTQDCLKPWAVSYETLLNGLPGGMPPEGTAHNLTPAEVAELTESQTPITLLQGSGNPVTSGNIAQVVTWEDNWPAQVPDANGSPYAKAIQTSTCPNKIIGPGSWLDTDPGAGSGQTGNPLKSFCEANGGVTNNGQNFTCNAQPRIKLVMWDTHNGATGNNLKYRVKYVGVFAITGFTKATGQPGTNPDQVHGFFSSMPSAGAFTGATGLTFKGAIVY